MLATFPDNDQKAAVWDAYHKLSPTRVPLRLNTNPRIILLDPKLNTNSYTFEQAMTDPQVHVEMALQYQHYLHTTLHQYCDLPTGLPEQWVINLYASNVYDAACLGAPVQYPGGQLPCTEPILTEDNKYDIFKVDISHPLDMLYVRSMLNFWREMDKVCHHKTFHGRPVRLEPWALLCTDGPMTVACNLRGTDFMMELIEQPQYAQKLLGFLTEAAINRRDAFVAYLGNDVKQVNAMADDSSAMLSSRQQVDFGFANGMADDSCAMLSPQMYEQLILPHHKRFYETGNHVARQMHLCGDASHLFGIIHKQLDVGSFDTGFPIDHGGIRRKLGTDVEISGGPPIAILLNSTPDEVYQCTREILCSGIKEGGRFILQEGNNLPPSVPLANLEAMYEACLEYGRYE